MKFERNFFTENQKLIQTCQQEVQQEEQQMTPEEFLAEQKKLLAGYRRLLEQAEQIRRRTVLAYDPVRHMNFLEIIEKALNVADFFTMDISAEFEEKKRGAIRLTTDILLLNEFCPDAIRRCFLEILAAADELQLDADGGLIKLSLFYKIYDQTLLDRPAGPS